ncbi:hypothetical protein CRG98_008883 [Punica granatum]|uniref:Uncharacterized protein n=1 Tax=Punica granatum TaxID=22663 RepID=A0A2I0KQP8_PUNGR|nr:hypothetical protein CRG98_008883 [Punica granatum]
MADRLPPFALLNYMSMVACVSSIVVSIDADLYSIFSSIPFSLSLCFRLCGQWNIGPLYRAQPLSLTCKCLYVLPFYVTPVIEAQIAFRASYTELAPTNYKTRQYQWTKSNIGVGECREGSSQGGLWSWKSGRARGRGVQGGPGSRRARVMEGGEGSRSRRVGRAWGCGGRGALEVTKRMTTQ